MPTDRLHAPDDEGELVTSMARILVVVTAVALLLLSTGCGKEAQDGIQTVAESPRRSATAACRLEYRTVETAVDAYTALYGKPPTSNDELLGEQGSNLRHPAPKAGVLPTELSPIRLPGG